MDAPPPHPTAVAPLPPPSQGTTPTFQPSQGMMVSSHVQAPGSTPGNAPGNAPSGEEQGPSLVEMLNRIDELDSIPRLQVHVQPTPTPAAVQGAPVTVQNVEITTASGDHVTEVPSSMQATTTAISTPSDLANLVVSKLSRHLVVQLPSDVTMTTGQKKTKVGRPRVKPPKERQEWHYHLGGMRHCRVPLSADLKEVLEVAYISKIMAKNFRKEGQPEKERIARITGMSLDKVQEWFKNRRKKDRLQKDRDTPRKRGRRSTTSSCGESVSEQTLNSSPGMEPMHVAMVMNPSVQVSQLVHTEVNTSSLAANTQTISNASMQ